MVKVLVAGEVRGELELLFNRVDKLNKSTHGQFDVLFCVGNFFGEDAVRAKTFLEEKGGCTIPCYFIVGDESNEALKELLDGKKEGGEIWPNVFFLGQAGVKEILGLRVAYIAGNLDTSAEDSPEETGDGGVRNVYSASQAKAIGDAVKHGSYPHCVDILLTAEWGKGVVHGLPSAPLLEVFPDLKGVEVLGNEAISRLALDVAPRYHFSTSPQRVFYQRPPYKNTVGVLTRFLSLGAVAAKANKTKKWIHALSLDPAATMDLTSLPTPPADVTENPFENAASVKAKQPDTLPPSKRQKTDGLLPTPTHALHGPQGQFFFDVKDQGQRGRGRGRREMHQGRERPKPMVEVAPRSDCWFCLSTPEVETHLIASIGEDWYLALPKGAISPLHCLIVPVAHTPSVSQLLSGEGKDGESTVELRKYIAALQSLYAKEGFALFLFERFFSTKGASHAHMQAVPVPFEAAERAAEIIGKKGDRYAMRFQNVDRDAFFPDIAKRQFYFFAEVYADSATPEASARFMHIVEGRYRLQFGREVACYMLRMPQRTDWKVCVVPKDEEVKMTEDFKKKFAPFDFTQE